MPLKDPTFSIGIEEEYLLVDKASRDLVREMPQALFDDCERALEGRVAREFLRSQLEVGTAVHETVGAAGAELGEARRIVARLADAHGLAPIAASTHPFTRWSAQEPTDRERYKAIARDLAGVGRRLVICGMHVHVGIDDDELRIDLMNQARYFLPHLLVLSTSSPFCEGEDTGLKCYRLAAYQELPRTGLPGRFESWEEYRQTVDVLVRNGVIEDASKIWWDLRPSARFPTLEMRVTDVCTRLEDAVCVAAMFVSILRMLYRFRRANQTWRTYPLFLLSENRWRAQRYGVAGTLFDFGKGELVAFRDLVDELIALLREDAEALGCAAELEHARTIVAGGTSADRQVACFERLLAQGGSRDEALRGVVDHLIAETAGLAAQVPPR
jgi:carboxylate-amine ligase